MDKITEVSGTIKEQDVKKDGILMPRKISNALGRGLRQSFAPAFQQIRSETEKLGDFKWTDMIKSGQEDVEFVLGRLEHSKEVRLVPEGKRKDNPGDHFEFSEETVPAEKPPAGTLTTDAMTSSIISALFHTFTNALSPVHGYAELMETDARNEGRIRESGRLMREASLQIIEKLNPLSGAENISLITDDNGKTSVIPLRSKNPQAI